MSGAILLTGATGFLGMETLARLIDRGERVIVLIRAEDDAGARERLAGVLASLYDTPPASAHVRALRADLLEDSLGLSEQGRGELVGSVDRIVHCAASISFDLPLAQAREINVQGTARVLELARKIAAGGSLRRVVHVSTAYVSGRHEGEFGEADLDVGQQFRNTYERSKHEAELLVREAGAQGLPLTVARPSIVVGHRRSGWTPAFNVLYWPMRAFERGLLKEVPAREDSIVDLVPVDYVTDGILALLDAPDVHGIYNLVAAERALTAGELVELHSSLTGRPPARFVPVVDDLPAGAETFVPYFDVRCRFSDARAKALLARAGVEKPDPRDYLAQLIAYARLARWGKRPVSRQASFVAAGAG